MPKNKLCKISVSTLIIRHHLFHIRHKTTSKKEIENLPITLAGAQRQKGLWIHERVLSNGLSCRHETASKSPPKRQPGSLCTMKNQDTAVKKRLTT